MICSALGEGPFLVDCIGKQRAFLHRRAGLLRYEVKNSKKTFILRSALSLSLSLSLSPIVLYHTKELQQRSANIDLIL